MVLKIKPFSNRDLPMPPLNYLRQWTRLYLCNRLNCQSHGHKWISYRIPQTRIISTCKKSLLNTFVVWTSNNFSSSSNSKDRTNSNTNKCKSYSWMPCSKLKPNKPTCFSNSMWLPKLLNLLPIFLKLLVFPWIINRVWFSIMHKT